MLTTMGFAVQSSFDAMHGLPPSGQQACCQVLAKEQCGEPSSSNAATQSSTLAADQCTSHRSEASYSRGHAEIDGCATLECLKDSLPRSDAAAKPEACNEPTTRQAGSKTWASAFDNAEGCCGAEGLEEVPQEDASVIWVQQQLPPSTAELKRLSSLQGGLARALTRSTSISISLIRRQSSFACQASRQGSGSQQQLMDSLSRESTPAPDCSSSLSNVASGLAGRAGSSTLASAIIHEDSSLDQESLPAPWLVDATEWSGCLDLPDWATGLDPQGYVSGRSRAHSGGGQSSDSNHLMPFTSSHLSASDLAKQASAGMPTMGCPASAGQPAQCASSNVDAALSGSCEAEATLRPEAALPPHALVLRRASSSCSNRQTPSMLFGRRSCRSQQPAKAPPLPVAVSTDDCDSPHWDDAAWPLPSPLTQQQLLAATTSTGPTTSWQTAERPTMLPVSTQHTAAGLSLHNLSLQDGPSWTQSADGHITLSVSRDSLCSTPQQAGIQGVPKPSQRRPSGDARLSWAAGLWSFVDTCITAMVSPESRCRAAGGQVTSLRLACSTPTSPSAANHMQARRLRHGGPCWAPGHRLAAAMGATSGLHRQLPGVLAAGQGSRPRGARASHSRTLSTPPTIMEVAYAEHPPPSATPSLDARTAWWGVQGQSFREVSRLCSTAGSDGSRPSSVGSRL